MIMNTTRNGKIARLPRDVREELNRRLDNNAPGGPLLAWLSGLDAPLVVTAAGGEMQPLLGRYAVSLLARLEAALAEGISMRELAGRLGARVVGPAELERFGDPLKLCSSINTPAELAAAGG